MLSYNDRNKFSDSFKYMSFSQFHFQTKAAIERTLKKLYSSNLNARIIKKLTLNSKCCIIMSLVRWSFYSSFFIIFCSFALLLKTCSRQSFHCLLLLFRCNQKPILMFLSLIQSWNSSTNMRFSDFNYTFCSFVIIVIYIVKTIDLICLVLNI